MEVYSKLPCSEKEKISALEKEIEAGLDPSLPGHSKHIEAWEEWSKADRIAAVGGLRVELRSQVYVHTSLCCLS